MKRFLLALLALIGIGVATPAAAYWEYGHQTVAAIAYKNVSPATRAAIDKLLPRSDLLETPTCPARTIEQASVWADCIKKLGPRFNYAFAWHFQDIELCKPFDMKSPCAGGNCVSAQIDRDIKLLKDKTVPVRERVMALAFLVHFVGDLHQPLHNEERNHDAGGNGVLASYGAYAPPKFNLHSIWDGPLAERAITTPPVLVRAYAPDERAPIQAGTVADWSRESWDLAHTAYATAFGRDPCAPGPEPARVVLSDQTIESLVPAARLQVLRGGLRLARLLDEALG